MVGGTKAVWFPLKKKLALDKSSPSLVVLRSVLTHTECVYRWQHVLVCKIKMCAFLIHRLSSIDTKYYIWKMGVVLTDNVSQ